MQTICLHNNTVHIDFIMNLFIAVIWLESSPCHDLLQSAVSFHQMAE